MTGRIGRLVPGLALACVLGAFGYWGSGWLGRDVLGFVSSPIAPVTVSIIAGMVIGNLVRLPAWSRDGLRFAVTRVLRLGIILLGIRLSVLEVARLGAMSVPVVVLCIAAGIGITWLVGRWLALPPRLGTLIGVGTSICGVSAVAATGPGIDARDEEVAYAIAVITVFGLAAMIVYPYITSVLFSGDPVAAGLFLGTAVHDTSQVNGSAMIYSDLNQSPRALDVAVVTKLVRNLFMIVVIPFMTMLHRRSIARSAETGGKAAAGARRLVSFVPLFVLGFVLMAVLRSAGDAGIGHGGAFGIWDGPSWTRLHGFVYQASIACMVVALSAVGLGTDFRALRRLSARPFFAGLGASLAVGIVSYAGIKLLLATGGR